MGANPPSPGSRCLPGKTKARLVVMAAGRPPITRDGEGPAASSAVHASARALCSVKRTMKPETLSIALLHPVVASVPAANERHRVHSVHGPAPLAGSASPLSTTRPAALARDSRGHTLSSDQPCHRASTACLASGEVVTQKTASYPPAVVPPSCARRAPARCQCCGIGWGGPVTPLHTTRHSSQEHARDCVCAVQQPRLLGRLDRHP